MLAIVSRKRGEGYAETGTFDQRIIRAPGIKSLSRKARLFSRDEACRLQVFNPWNMYSEPRETWYFDGVSWRKDNGQ